MIGTAGEPFVQLSWQGRLLFVGDFNAILKSEEKWSRTPFQLASSNDFLNFHSITSLVDIGLRGNSFTWANNNQSKNMSQLGLKDLYLTKNI